MKDIDIYDLDLSDSDIDELERRRDLRIKKRINERHALQTALMCDDLIDESLSVTNRALKTSDLGEKDDLYKLSTRVATLAVKMQQIHLMKVGLLPPVSATKDTQESYEAKVIKEYEERAQRRKEQVTRVS
jgi:hypothetical protein